MLSRPYRQWRAVSALSELIRLGLPLMAAQLAQMSMGFIDTVMVGQVSARDLAAIALGNSLWMPLYLFVLGVLMATGTSVAHLYGRQQFAEIGTLTRQGLWLALMLALPSIVLIQFAGPVMAGLAVDPSIRTLAQDYLQALAWGIPGTFIYTTLRFTSEGVGRTRVIMWVSVVGLAVNIIGNYLLIYGLGWLPALGAVGCGYATALAMTAMAVALYWIMNSVTDYHSYRLFTRIERPRWSSMGALLGLGLPIGCSIFAESSIFAAVTLLLGQFGATVLAGHQIAFNVASLTFMVPLSLGMALTIRVGHAAGRGDPADAQYIGLHGIVTTGIVMIALAAVILTLAPAIAAVYSDQPDVLMIATGLLYYAALFQVSDGLQVSANSALRGLKDTRIPMIITVTAYWIIGLPTGYLLCFIADLGAPGLWIGLIAGLSSAAIMLNLRFYQISRSG